jgi:transposase
MGRKTKALSHLTLEQIKQKIKTTKGFWKVQQWLIVYNALADPRKSESIAKHVSVSKATVNKTISEYNRFGPSIIECKSKGGRRRSYLTYEEEKEFLYPYIALANEGKIATAKEIHIAFNEKVGKQVAPSTIYRLLERHQWREIVPRTAHPKADKQAQEAFKKTLKH